MRGAGTVAQSLTAALATFVLTACAATAPVGIAEPSQTPTAAASGSPAASGAPSTSAVPPAEVSTLPDPDKLAAALGKVSRKGISASGIVVLDAATGTELASRGDKPLVPASALKVLTAMTALDSLGPDATFTTSVVEDGDSGIILVGGGDPLLTDASSESSVKPASLERLAAATAKALKAAGTRKVSLGYDNTRFTGTSWNPGWDKTWRAFTPPVSALGITGGQLNQWQAEAKPALAAAKAFAARLAKRGIKVTTIKARSAEAEARTLASASSATVSRLVRNALLYSNNVTTEILARQAALASGRAGSFTGATQTIRAWLRVNGLWTEGMTITDASGLSKRSKVTPSSLAGAIRLALGQDRYAGVVNGLPVAGKSGTLKTRFNDSSEKAGRGVVHAKTGTLRNVASLAGYTTTKDGAVLVFAAIANKTAGRTTGYNWLDRSAAVLTRCGCR